MCIRPQMQQLLMGRHMQAGSLSLAGNAGAAISVKAARGFTLIELLVVLAVLALLASLVAPRYLARVDDAKETVLKQNLVAGVAQL